MVPGLCTGPFWTALFDLVQAYRGNLAVLMQERCKREKAFEKEQDREPNRNWAWWDQKRETIRKALGFFIGETPVWTVGVAASVSSPAASVATGPP